MRLKYPYEHSTLTLPGALRMPPGALDRTRLPKDREIVTYDSDPDELVAERVADELNRFGYRASALAGRHRRVGHREVSNRPQIFTPDGASSFGLAQVLTPKTRRRPSLPVRAWSKLIR